MDQANGSPTPMVSTSNLSTSIGSLISIKDEEFYRSIASVLQYIVITRPEIAFAVNKICQFMQQPLDLHSKAIKRILRYLKDINDFGIFLSQHLIYLLMQTGGQILMIEDQLRAIVYSLRSIQSHGVQRNKKQLVSRSTAEAEYKSIANATADIYVK